MRYVILLLIFAFSCAPQEKEVLDIHIRSNDPEGLIQWYTTNLGLSQSTIPNEWQVRGQSFTLTFSKTEIEKPAGRTAGFFKYGFTTNRLDELYQEMQDNGVSFRGEPFFDENLKQRSLVTLDSDGNRVQFFEDNTKPDLSPYFISVMTNEFDTALAWYQSEIGFDEGFNLGLPERNLNIRLMRNENWVLELITMPGINPEATNQPGIAAIGDFVLK